MYNQRRITAVLVSFILFFFAATAAFAADVEEQLITLPSKEGSIAVERYAAQGISGRSSVLILHGGQGVEKFHDHYKRFALALAESGFDAYLVNYYVGDDAQRAKELDTKNRQAYFSKRIHVWTQVVSTVMDSILSSDLASGRVALLGFSQGGFLATAAASMDHRVTALGVFYGGIPTAVKSEITRLPPLLELHGDADLTVPLEEGIALVDLAKSFGQPCEMIVYPGAGHGFFGKDDMDSKQRTVDFFRRYL